MSRRKRPNRSKRRPAHPRLPSDPRRINWEAVDWARIDSCVAGFDISSLAVLLAAAADSPGGGHRLPSLTLLWLRCLAQPPAGQITASAKDLPRLLAAARGAAPQLRALEDCWLADPQLVACYPSAGRRFRVHPGSWVDPVLTLRSVTAVAEAIDDFTLERHGFRLTDLLEVALRYSDQRVGVLAGAWPAAGLARDSGDPEGEGLRARVRRIGRTAAVVTEAEIAVSMSAGSDPGEWIAACGNPARAAAAWEWATRPASDVEVDLAPGTGRLGAVLAVTSAGRDWPVPASLVVSAIAVAAAELAREASGDERSVRGMQQVTARRALGLFGHPVVTIGSEEPHPGEEGGPPIPAVPVAVAVPAAGTRS